MAENTQSVLERTAADQWKVLPSGLTVLVRPMPGYSGTHVIYATRFGSIDRDFRLDGKEVHLPAGVAHFLEHKMFEDEDGDAFAKFAKTGANANAFTAFDRTCYLFTATEQLDESLDVLLGMVGHPYFTEQTIAKEQGIIGQEIKMYDDSPDWRLITGLCECLYHSHPIRSDIAGTVESIAELTPQMLYSCTRGFYAPSNMVLSVAGKITLAQAVDACKRNGLYRARAPHEVEWDIPAQTGPLPHKEAFFTMPVTKPCFGVAYREEPLAEGDLKRELLLDMLGDLVVGGLTKLYRRLYDEALVNPEFSGDFIAVRGACTVAFTGESDTPRQVMVYEALGAPVPTFAHISMILGADGKKLSKRHGATSVEEYRDAGYLPDAFVNYLALLGWSPRGEQSEQEFFTLDELVGAFDIGGISKSPAIFDIEKLTYFNANYLRNLPPEEFCKVAEPYIRQAVKNEAYSVGEIAALLQARCEKLTDIPEKVDFFDALPEYGVEFYTNKKSKTNSEVSLDMLNKVLPKLESLPEWTNDAIHDMLVSFAEELGVKNATLMWPLRIAVAGKLVTPGGAVEICHILGREETIKRVKAGIAKLA